MNTIFLLKTDVLPHITYLGSNQVSHDWKHFRRTTNEHIMYVIESGDFYIRESEKEYHLTRGDTIIMEPNKEHIGYKNAACSYFYAHFSTLPVVRTEELDFSRQDEQVQRVLQLNYNASPLSDELYTAAHLLLPKCTHIGDASSFHHIQTLIQTAIEESLSKKIYYKVLASCRFIEVFQALSRNWMNTLFISSSMHISDIMYEKSNQLLDYLHISYAQKITGSKIETLFSVNFDYLNRIFKIRTGNTIFAYLNNIRLEQAKQLLTTSRLSLKEISVKSGFSDEYYFSRFFKKQIGIAPSLYRQQRS